MKETSEQKYLLLLHPATATISYTYIIIMYLL